MRMSADDDDQADQRHELAYPGMAETDRSVLDTPWPQLYSRPVVVNAAGGGLQGRQWCGLSVTAGTADELQRWAEIELSLVAQPMWSFQSGVESRVTQLVDRNSHLWHSGEYGVADERQQNSMRQVFRTEELEGCDKQRLDVQYTTSVPFN